ncbi:MAG TPA: bifunctional glutamate N-acetyltransferase/amino-acid acetyltransferase ArgJ [Polyangiaceae bacterium]|nr:bifunctional glutamate N-acetyltransferase/amino-acid acetyltransferase ArgJ [Polyangiaceae bacterium]
MRRRLFDDWNAHLTVADSVDPAHDVLSFESRTEGREVRVDGTLAHQPAGFTSAAVCAGIKTPGVLDFSVVRLDEPGPAAGVFTKNRCPGYAVEWDREHLAGGRAQLLAVVSKNANVFTPHGAEDTREMARRLAREFRVLEGDIVLSCTGVIGVPLPMSKIGAAVEGLSSQLAPGGLDAVSRAILTTDRAPKVCSVRFGDVVVCAMAKGAGMIEPNMATMLVYFFTNADVPAARLKEILTTAVERTFNSISVDSDTSTSDSVVVFSTRRARVDAAADADLADAVRCMSIKLARDVVSQAEGATKLIECTVRSDGSVAEAKAMAKKIVNSPLVKTAVFGGDPNWGRVVMAIGKPDGEGPGGSIDRRDVTIEMMGQVLCRRAEPVTTDLDALARSIKSSSRVSIDVCVGEGRHRAKVWGCDLSHRYVEINAEYMT